jgi:hypothetical protein
MSTAMSIFNSSALPAHIAARELNQNTLALAGNVSTGRRISIEGGVFRMIVDGKEVAKNTDRAMNVVIVRTAPSNSRTYYDPKVEYVRGQASPPLCSSTDGIKPDARIKSPQATSCDKCPQNIAGSGRGDSRACRYSRRLAVVLEGDISGDVYQLQLPATSIFGRKQGTQQLPMEAYARMLASNRVNVDSVVTKVEFDTDAAVPTLMFSPERYLSADELETVISQGETPEAEQAVGSTPYALDAGATAQQVTAQPIAPPVTKAEKAPAEKKAGFVKAEADEPQPEPTVEEGVDEPVQAPTPPAEVKSTPQPSTKIKSVLEAWGD